MEATRTLYFGYGSNLDPVDIARWLAKNGLAGPLLDGRATHALLPDHRLGFNLYSRTRGGGVLNAVPDLGHTVPGLLYEVTPRELELLDRKEGHPGFYRRREATVLGVDGRPVRAWTYLADGRGPFVEPTPTYREVIAAGYEAHALDGLAQLRDAAAGGRPGPLVPALFTYGTLMRGQPRFGCVPRERLACALAASTRGGLLDLGDYPALTLEAEGIVEGDFFRFDGLGISSALEALDRVEGFRGFGEEGSLFERRIVAVDVGDGHIREAWVYVTASASEGALHVESGDWREHTRTRQRFLVALAKAHAGDDSSVLIARLAGRSWWPRDSHRHRRYLAALTPLENALANGLVSERDLAQVSGLWTALCEMAGTGTACTAGLHADSATSGDGG
jgi:gamma-glutamylcyclotransferase (GGCT)/AIG2-like uncharacterized protein YtfP